jgi:hypothetical protein
MINSTNLKIVTEKASHCWYCTRQMNSQSMLAIPYKYEDDTFYGYGYFCSFPCALTYLHSSVVTNKCDHESLLYLLYYKSGGKGEIPQAPPKEILRKYGGNYSEEEYGKLLNNSLLLYQIKIPSIISSPKEINIITANEYTSLCTSLTEMKEIYFPHYAMQLKKSRHTKYRVARRKPLYNNTNLNKLSVL